MRLLLGFVAGCLPLFPDVGRGLSCRRAGRDDAVHDVHRAHGRAGDEDARSLGDAWSGVRRRDGDKTVSTERQAEGRVDRRPAPCPAKAPPGHESARRFRPVSVISTLTIGILLRVLSDQGHFAAYEFHAHRFGVLVELLVALAEGADVHVVDGDVGHGQRAVEQHGLFDGIHAADARAISQRRASRRANRRTERRRWKSAPCRRRGAGRAHRVRWAPGSVPSSAGRSRWEFARRRILSWCPPGSDRSRWP